MPKIKTKQGDIYYIKKGRKTTKPIMICCHGGPGGTHHSLLPLLKLSEDRQVIIYDQIGSGKSSSISKDKYRISTFVENLNEIIDHFSDSAVILYGSSWGGTLILEYVKKYPKKVAGLIFHSSLINEAYWRKDALRLIKKLSLKDQKIIKNCEEVGATDSKVYKQAMNSYYLKHVCRDKKAYLTKKKRKFNEELYNHMWGPSEFCATGTLKKYNGIPTLKKISVPTLFICGEFDESTPASNKIFSHYVKNSMFKVIKKASHSSLREKPKESLFVINQFLTQI